jgi:uncharacterized protein
VASNVISLLDVVLPAAERWFVDTLNEALPLVKDPHLADDIRGFIGQEAMHADVHEQVLHECLVVNGIDPKPMLDQVGYAFEKVLAPTTSTDPKRRLDHLCDRLWLIAAIEHYTPVLGDFALNCAWDDHNAVRQWSTCSAGTAARRSSTAWWRTASRSTSTTATSTGSAP